MKSWPGDAMLEQRSAWRLSGADTSWAALASTLGVVKWKMNRSLLGRLRRHFRYGIIDMHETDDAASLRATKTLLRREIDFIAIVGFILSPAIRRPAKMLMRGLATCGRDIRAARAGEDFGDACSSSSHNARSPPACDAKKAACEASMARLAALENVLDDARIRRK